MTDTVIKPSKTTAKQNTKNTAMPGKVDDMGTSNDDSYIFGNNGEDSTESEVIEQWAEHIHEDIQKRKDELVRLDGRNALISCSSKKKIEYTGEDSLDIISNSISASLDVVLLPNNNNIVSNKKDKDLRLFYIDEKEFKEYQQTFNKIIKKQQEFAQEKGIHSLFICFGKLVWTNNKDQANHSPLFLCPIDIEKLTDENYKVSFLENSFTLNHALMIALTKSINEFEGDNKSDRFDSFKVWKHPDEFKACIDAFNNELNKYKSNFSADVIEDSIILMNLDYENVALYEHISSTDVQDINENKILQDIFNGKEEKHTYRTNEFNKTELTNLEKETYQLPTIEDADSSQLLAIEKVLEGKNLLVQGPPGTGKSRCLSR